ncbi:biopolymer transporter ExbD [Pelagicoccus sp. SDUM812005]|uniref:biopolymer transporter ExbD n=1 Tax=Pelagicoccus sp. SDUM812005 TaxID=3041257 RepID=UPI00280EA24E|nr:biopolymer transporter ExbD [Pelagicoccus sp. SDUM812005]MDQ8183892.1 hypothetical protein [Pelagicoccus sp. SDUM812005]
MKTPFLILPILLLGCVKEPSVEDIKPVTNDTVESKILYVVLNPDREIESNGQTYESDEITTLVKERKEGIESVILAVNPKTKASEVVRIIDLIKLEGIEKIFVSTLEE